MDIELGISRFEIKVGEELRVETRNVSDKFEVYTDNNTLKITDEKADKKWFSFNRKTPEVILYIPQYNSFNKVEIETGVRNY